MNLTGLTLLSRKIHRALVLIIFVLGLVMSVTGMAMKYPGLFPIDPLASRRFHNTVSTFFGPVLGIMSFTGLLMYLYPWLQKVLRKKSAPTP